MHHSLGRLPEILLLTGAASVPWTSGSLRLGGAVLALLALAAVAGERLPGFRRHRRFLGTRIGSALLAAAVVGVGIWGNLLVGVDARDTVVLLAAAAVTYLGLCLGMLDACDELWPPHSAGEDPRARRTSAA